MPDYRLIYRVRGKPSEAICFSAGSPAKALAIAQKHGGPAELWADDDYVTTLCLAEGGFWTLCRESEVLSRGRYTQVAQTSRQSERESPWGHKAKAAASMAWSHD
jgi:hypothetical protein